MLQITPAERLVLQLLAQGTPVNAIAAQLGVTSRDVETHLITLFAQLGASGPTEAIAVAARRGLLVPDLVS